MLGYAHARAQLFAQENLSVFTCSQWFVPFTPDVFIYIVFNAISCLKAEVMVLAFIWFMQMHAHVYMIRSSKCCYIGCFSCP
jgi:hypothetical protein